ncbi:MAG: tRNA 2-thiouridine(34) synthase MnmA [Verrucomicrobiales bacterium]|nr:tRNA 2-thiouridine(34) synthase MnmA [Verrucomicrobiales bacterium]
MAKILVAMSGGVDSSVAAALLLQQGHEVVGAYMKNWINEEGLPGDCPWQQDIIDARSVADHLGIELRILSLMDAYRERVVDYMLKGYRDGVTPNPDVMCNREMKFGVFRDFALGQGFDAIATGHYARIRQNAEGEGVDVLRGMDGNKDQTYFLALLQQEQISKVLFPVGELPKSEVRSEAERFEIPVAKKKDSQGICFMGNVKMADFLKHYIKDQPGDIVTVDGKVVGQHQGLHLYTFGQRKGLRVSSPVYGKAYVLVEKRPQSNELVVAFDELDTPNLYASRCQVTSISLTHRPLSTAENLSAQPRYRCPSVAIKLLEQNDNGSTMTIEFDQPQRALTPGQICAFYDGEVLMGGGVFQQIDYSS